MKFIESFARPLSVVVCASLAGGCILTTNGDDDTGQEGTGDDDDGSVTADDDDPSVGDDDPSADDNGTEPDTGNETDDTTGGPVGECSENLVLDPGFEAGSPSKVWDEASTTFGTPICDTGCTEDTGVGPYEGDWWAWFGGLEEQEAASVAQSVTIPAAESALLTFRFEINSTTGTGDDEFSVLIDGTEVWGATDAEMDDYADYTRVEVDVTAFADGEAHTIRFESDHPGHPDTGLITNFFLDSVSLVTCNEGGTESGDSGSADSTTAADVTTAGSESESGSSGDTGSSDSGGSESSSTTN
jgi:hypothetical protein